jgi:GPH family glycoside/pentoside/hexuronide:cation symporter
VRDVMRNKPFMILLVSYTIAALGSNLPGTLILYYVQYVLRADNANAFLLLYFVVGILFLPGWIALARRFEKKTTWLAAMALNTSAFLGVFFLGSGDTLWYGTLVVLSGVGFGATVTLPSSMQADVIDYDEMLSGTRREGQYIGFWSIAKKIAAALGIGIALSVLGLAGYVPNVEQSPQVQMTVLYALVPSLCNIIALSIAFAYPISAKMHQQIRTAIADRQAGRVVADPLRNPRIEYEHEFLDRSAEAQL